MSSKGKTLKAGVWYTISNFLNRALGVILTPIMTRLLTTNEYGDFANFSTWASLLVVITTLDMGSAITRAKFDYEENYTEYMSSITLMTMFSTAFFYLWVIIFPAQFASLLDMDIRYLHMLFLYLFFTPACTYFSSYHRAQTKYKLATFVTLLKNLLTVVLSISFVILIEDGLWGRTIGFVLPSVLLGMVIYVFFIWKGRKFSWEAVKYTLKMSIPLIPHNLSNGVLFSADKIVIKKFCSAEKVAIYSLGYSISNILYMFVSAINQAFVPWLYENIEKRNCEGVKKTQKTLIYAMYGLTFGVILVAPECILFFGGEKYNEVISVLPIIVVGGYFQYLYTIYVNYEFYSRNTALISTGTMLAAGVNLGLNLLLIPFWGYVMAGYTTLLSYITLFLVHFKIIKKTEYITWVDNRQTFIMGGGSLLLIPMAKLLYTYRFLRYVVIAIYILLLGVVLYRLWRKKIKDEKTN